MVCWSGWDGHYTGLTRECVHNQLFSTLIKSCLSISYRWAVVVIYLSLWNYCDRPYQDNVFQELLGLMRTLPFGTLSPQEYACRTTQDILQATRAGMTMLFVRHVVTCVSFPAVPINEIYEYSALTIITQESNGMHTSNIASRGYAVPNPCDELWLHTLLNTSWDVVVTG